MNERNSTTFRHLSRRENQIMDVIFQLGEATAVQVLENMPAPPGYSSVRVLLGILEKKGYLTHRKEGTRFVYKATIAPEKAKQSALHHLLKTFFNGSIPEVVATLFSVNEINEEDLKKISDIISRAKEQE